ncbi:MAG: tetratricopeptide repeat protein [Chitinophagaceae bacterium]|nr:tetratricopeptide repeat protein [Chitinophagaceae bacterium]
MKKLLLTASYIFYFFYGSFAQQPGIDSLLLVVSKPQQDTGTVIAYRMLAGLVRSSNPLKAAAYGNAGVALGRKLGFDKGVAGCLLNIAACYSAASKMDAALLYIDSAILYSLKVGEPNRIALAYLNRADLHMKQQNLTQSLLDCDSSMHYAEISNNDDRRARVLQTIGSVYYLQQLYRQSADYYDKAYLLYQKIGNSQMSAIVLNNLGNVYKHVKEYEKSVRSFLRAIAIGDSLNDLNNLSMYHENISDAYLQQGNLEAAEKHGLKAMVHAVQQDISTQKANAWECLGSVYLQQKKYPAAIDAGLKAYEIAKAENDVNILFETSDLLAEAYAQSGSHSRAFEFLKINKEINDSLVKKQYDQDIAAMQTRFKVTEKDKEIKILNKDSQLQQQQIKQQRFLIAASAAIVLLSLFGIRLFINRNRLRQRMKELELRNQIAADLHDEVGSSLSSIHMLSQMATRQGNDATHKDILERMSNNAKETMDKMGDIVWMIKPGESESGSLKQRMQSFAYEICSTRNISTLLQLDELEKVKLTMEQRKNIYLIFKEAMNNAVKYSGTEKIEATASLQNNQVILTIRDFGKGFDIDMVKKGNGLENIQHRAKELGGNLSFKSAHGEGTMVKLTMQV